MELVNNVVLVMLNCKCWGCLLCENWIVRMAFAYTQIKEVLQWTSLGSTLYSSTLSKLVCLLDTRPITFY